jgi:hypothetical protein
LDHNHKKLDLLAAIGEAKDEATSYMEIGRSMIERGQYVKDIADASETLIRSASLEKLPEDEIDREVGAWGSAAHAIRSIVQGVSSQHDIGYVTSILTSAASGLIMYNGPSPSCSSIDPGAITIPVQRLNDVLEKADWMEQVRRQLVRLHLGSAISGVRSPQALLDEANTAYLRPSSGAPNPAAILIPLREAILALVAELLRRRPKQESTSSQRKKIESICAQCGRSTLDSGQVSHMADEYDRIVNDLSNSKQAQMDRQQIRASLTRGFAFLEGFLGMIDDTKLQ